jgi:hypothetical protein
VRGSTGYATGYWGCWAPCAAPCEPMGANFSLRCHFTCDDVKTYKYVRTYDYSLDNRILFLTPSALAMSIGPSSPSYVEPDFRKNPRSPFLPFGRPIRLADGR